MKKRYKVLLISLLCVFGISAGVSLFFYIRELVLTEVGTASKGLTILTSLLSVVSVMAIFILIYIYKRIQINLISSSYFYSDEVKNLVTTSRFVRMANRLYKRRKADNNIFIISLGFEHFSGLKLSTLTEDELRDVLSLVSKYLLEKFVSLKDNFSYVAYEGNGEFFIYLDRLNAESVQSEVDAAHNDLHELLKDKPYAPSIALYFGVYQMEQGNRDFDAAINYASMARYYNEQNTRVHVLMFEPYMQKENRENMKMKYDIERGLAAGEFEVFYQPKYSIKLNRFVGAEALVRWRHPEKGLLSPGAFIPFAEQNGLIVDIDRFVLDKVCRDIVSWKENKTRLLLISVNLSRNEIFKNDIIDFYTSTLAKYHVSPLLIDIEITESAASKDMLYVINIIQQLKSLRFKTSMDDFGTGYSSLSYLKKMPVDTLKLDKSFFDEIEIDKRSRDIVSTTIKLAKALDMQVIAEGIQTEKQVQFLKTTECDMIQGYFYSRPISKNDYEAFLRHNKFEGETR